MSYIPNLVTGSFAPWWGTLFNKLVKHQILPPVLEFYVKRVSWIKLSTIIWNPLMLVVVNQFDEKDDHLKTLTDNISGLECAVLLGIYE
jgi:hypothetical protein